MKVQVRDEAVLIAAVADELDAAMAFDEAAEPGNRLSTHQITRLSNPARQSLVSQRVRRIEPRCAAGRPETRSQRHEDEQQGNRGQRRAVARATLHEQALQQASDADRAADADREAPSSAARSPRAERATTPAAAARPAPYARRFPACTATWSMKTRPSNVNLIQYGLPTSATAASNSRMSTIDNPSPSTPPMTARSNLMLCGLRGLCVPRWSLPFQRKRPTRAALASTANPENRS
jgi:hypothetical protein